MELVVFIVVLGALYAAKAASIARDHDEIIADDVFMCWSA